MGLFRRIKCTSVLGLVLALIGPPAVADQVWSVSLDTALLTSNYAGPFALDFELIGSNRNTVTLTNFSFGTGGGAGPAAAFLTGGAGGDLDSSVILNDGANFFSDFNEQFTPGGMLTFTVDSTLVAPPSGGTPDNFSMVIFEEYDPINGYNPFSGTGGIPIPTTDPTGVDTFFNIDVNGPGQTTVNSYPTCKRGYPDHRDSGRCRPRTIEWPDDAMRRAGPVLRDVPAMRQGVDRFFIQEPREAAGGGYRSPLNSLQTMGPHVSSVKGFLQIGLVMLITIVRSMPTKIPQIGPMISRKTRNGRGSCASKFAGSGKK